MIVFFIGLNSEVIPPIRCVDVMIIDGAFLFSYILIAEYLYFGCSIFLLTVGVLKVNRFIWMLFDWKQNNRSSIRVQTRVEEDAC